MDKVENLECLYQGYGILEEEWVTDSPQSAKDMGPTRAPYGILYGSYMGTPGHPIWDWDGICNMVLCGTHMGKPIWVTNENHMGPILDLAQVAHFQPTFVE